jgi:hypothetical protein
MRLNIEPNFFSELGMMASFSLQNTLKALKQTGQPTDRLGGYLHLAFRSLPGLAPEEPLPFFSGFIGEVNVEKLPQYQSNATEKVGRLFKNPTHVSSWQSRDEEKQHLGGGIRFTVAVSSILSGGSSDQDIPCLGAFSGLPEHGDETLLLLLMRKQFVWRAENSKIIDASDNAIARHLRLHIAA